MSYYFYNAVDIIIWYQRRYEIRKGSLLDFNKNLTLSSWANMPVNSLDSSTHLFPTKFMFDLPTVGVNKTYSELMDERAQEIITYARTNNKVMQFSWSGGIDSTCILVALLKQDGEDILTVLCNASSIYENRRFFENHLKDKVKIKYVQDSVYQKAADTLFVRSSGADTLMGGDFQTLFLYAYRDQVLDKPNLDIFGKMVNFITPALDPAQIELLYNQTLNNAKALNVELNTVWDSVAMYDLCHKLQRMYWLDEYPHIFKNDTPKEDVADIDSWVKLFYLTPKFYAWALHDATVYDKIGNDLFGHKKVMKDYIYDYDRNSNYHEHKTKFSSLGARIIPKFAKYHAIDEEYNYLHAKELLDYLHAANEKMIT